MPPRLSVPPPARVSAPGPETTPEAERVTPPGVKKLPPPGPSVMARAVATLAVGSSSPPLSVRPPDGAPRLPSDEIASVPWLTVVPPA